MAKRSCVTAAIAVVGLALGAYAQGPGKVGVISVQGAIVGTKDGQKAAAALEAKFQPKRKDIEGRQTPLGLVGCDHRLPYLYAATDTGSRCPGEMAEIPSQFPFGLISSGCRRVGSEM